MLIFANFKIIYGDMKNHNRRNKLTLCYITHLMSCLEKIKAYMPLPHLASRSALLNAVK